MEGLAGWRERWRLARPSFFLFSATEGCHGREVSVEPLDDPFRRDRQRLLEGDDLPLRVHTSVGARRRPRFHVLAGMARCVVVPPGRAHIYDLREGGGVRAGGYVEVRAATAGCDAPSGRSTPRAPRPGATPSPTSA